MGNMIYETSKRLGVGGAVCIWVFWARTELGL